MTDADLLARALMLIHGALPSESDPCHCAVCGQRIRQVPGGHGMTWVHSDTGAVAAPNPPAKDPS